MRKPASWVLAGACAACSGHAWAPPPTVPQAWVLAPSDERLDQLIIPPVVHESVPISHEQHVDQTAARAAVLKKKIAQFAPVELSSPALDKLAKGERDALELLVKASKVVHGMYLLQAVPEHDRAQYEKLAGAGASELGALESRYFAIMASPWDRLDHTPFATDRPRPPGAALYPDDLTAADLDAYLAAHPDQKKALLDLFTVVKRDGDGLVAVPYSKAYETGSKLTAGYLREAAKLTKNKSLAKFLESRAAALLNDDYYQSDKDWMDLDAEVEVTIGPYEQYEDELKGQKTAFESFVTITDAAESKKLAKYKRLLPDMQKNLPIDEPMKGKRGFESPIRVVDLVFSAGDARRGVMTTAFNLPNDERVRKEKGAKKVLLRNVLENKFAKIMKPIGERILDPAQQKWLSSDAFVNEVLFHELSHSLGPSTAKKDDKTVDIPVALEELHGAIEEPKADVMGAYNVLYMVKKKELPASLRDELLVSYFAGLFRSVRFGVDAHGRGAALQINRYLEEGAAKFDAASGRFTVDLDQLEKSITKLTHDLCAIEFNGDKAGAKALLDKYGQLSTPIRRVQEETAAVPVDLAPIYPLAGEKP